MGDFLSVGSDTSSKLNLHLCSEELKENRNTTFRYMIHCHLLTSMSETSSDTTQIISFTTQNHPKMSHFGKYYSRIKLLKSGVTISKPFVCRLLLTYESVAAGPY